jgi:hypothetical protein
MNRDLTEEIETLATTFRQLAIAAGCKIESAYVAVCGSHYFRIENPTGCLLKVRISDHSEHSDRHAEPDIDLIVGEQYGAAEAVHDVVHDWIAQ